MIDLDSYSIFSQNKSTFKETSKDDHDLANVQYMVDSELEVIDFDRVKRQYTNDLGLSEESAASADAIVRFNQRILFVEFKNGKVENRNIKDKIRDTLLIFSDITKIDVAYARSNIDFIVVYNIEKNPLPNQLKKQRIQDSPSRIAIGECIAAKAQKELILFDLEKYQKLYFREIHTYSKEKFEEYLQAK